MNKAQITGRFTKDPEVRYTSGQNPLAVANFTVAVNRRYKQQGQPEADFIPCTAFGKVAEFIEKYFRKGMKIEVCGRISTGSYTNKDGNKVYTWGITVEEAEFAESKSQQTAPADEKPKSNYDPTGFMNIPDGIDEELPFT
jgi:single-strand DNA-binding protein